MRASAVISVLTLGASLGLASQASAQQQLFGEAFDVAFGGAVTSNYVSSGISQSANGPAVQAYIEKTFGMAYAAAWASTVRFEDESDVEIDLGVGLRPEWGPLEFDFGYTYVLYAGGIEDAEHELHAAVEWAANDWLTLEKEIEWGPAENEWTFEGGAELEFGNGFALFGGLGYALFSEVDETDYLFWRLGASYTYLDTITFSVAYSDTNLTEDECDDQFDAPTICGPAFLATLSFDTTLGGLFGGAGADLDD